jgi:hypothetical protein
LLKEAHVTQVQVKPGQVWRDHLGAHDNDPSLPISSCRRVKVLHVSDRLNKYGKWEGYAEIVNCSQNGIIPIGPKRTKKARLDRFGKSGGYVLVKDVEEKQAG